jgi:hypothetical protein
MGKWFKESEKDEESPMFALSKPCSSWPPSDIYVLYHKVTAENRPRMSDGDRDDLVRGDPWPNACLLRAVFGLNIWVSLGRRRQSEIGSEMYGTPENWGFLEGGASIGRRKTRPYLCTRPDIPGPTMLPPADTLPS